MLTALPFVSFTSKSHSCGSQVLFRYMCILQKERKKSGHDFEGICSKISSFRRQEQPQKYNKPLFTKRKKHYTSLRGFRNHQIHVLSSVERHAGPSAPTDSARAHTMVPTQIFFSPTMPWHSSPCIQSVHLAMYIHSRRR